MDTGFALRHHAFGAPGYMSLALIEFMWPWNILVIATKQWLMPIVRDFMGRFTFRYDMIAATNPVHADFDPLSYHAAQLPSWHHLWRAED